METKHQLEWAEFKSAIMATPKVQVKRFDNGTNRFYYFGEEEKTIAAGITSVLSNILPESDFVTEWKLKYGKDWRKVLESAASYGTFMHQIYSEWLVKRYVPKELLDSARKVCTENSKSSDMPEKDLLSFIKFCEDYKVEPLVLEGLLISEPVNGDHYAMAIDCLCKMTITDKTKETVEDGVYVRGDKKGQVKYKEVTNETSRTIIANLDFKSNFFEKDSKSFYESHLYQLIAAKRAVEYNFSVEVDSMFNFSPNAWRKEPTYSLKEWKPTEIDYKLFDAYINLAQLKGLFTPKGNIFVAPEFNENTKWSDYKVMDYIEYISTL